MFFQIHKPYEGVEKKGIVGWEELLYDLVRVALCALAVGAANLGSREASPVKAYRDGS